MYVPRTRTNYGNRSFSINGPSVWNSLPVDLRAPDISIDIFFKSIVSVPLHDRLLTAHLRLRRIQRVTNVLIIIIIITESNELSNADLLNAVTRDVFNIDVDAAVSELCWTDAEAPCYMCRWILIIVISIVRLSLITA